MVTFSKRATQKKLSHTHTHTLRAKTKRETSFYLGMKSFVYTKYSTECIMPNQFQSIILPKMCYYICSLGGNVQDLVLDNSRIASETRYENSSLTVAALFRPG